MVVHGCLYGLPEDPTVWSCCTRKFDHIGGRLPVPNWSVVDVESQETTS